MRDVLEEIWQTSKRNKLRTALTGFAVAWGIFMIIFLLGAGNGLINAQLQSFDRFVDNSMMIFGGQTSKAYNGLAEGRPITLDNADVAATQHNFTGNVEDVGAQLQQAGQTVSLDQNYVNSTLYGVYPNETSINKIKMMYGRFVNQIDFNQRRKVLVVSDTQAKELYTGDIRMLIGKYVKAGNIAFEVVGIYQDDKTSQGNTMYTAFSTLQTMFGMGDNAGNIEFTFHGLKTEEDNEVFEKTYRALLNRNHQADPSDENSIWIWNRFTQAMQMDKGIGIIRTALWVIGLFTLLSGIVGVSNIMLITVKERTREFGIRKAIGAKPLSILRLIIVESVIITTFFGYIGMILGIAANQYMDITLGHKVMDIGIAQFSMFVNPTVGLDVCVEATLVMIIAGTLAGLVPARKAARIRPIEALNAE
ncbi:MAG: ABC transporter permease [Prevotella sp.]|jgi:putative ABC transport system permease protein|nr:ABC transporter permease [Prevotella sp.]MCI2081262.1 ABC transporter permease [Prevotella sp.]MCI2103101.1 ABC transporter permease [Prevotella sp.]